MLLSTSQVIHTGATFNKTLWHLIGSTISTEARAMNNVGRAGLSFWAPNINTIPDPRWGRAQETPGEDPYATGMYAANFVTGMQEGEDMNYIKVSSCCKVRVYVCVWVCGTCEMMKEDGGKRPKIDTCVTEPNTGRVKTGDDTTSFSLALFRLQPGELGRRGSPPLQCHELGS